MLLWISWEINLCEALCLLRKKVYSDKKTKVPTYCSLGSINFYQIKWSLPKVWNSFLMPAMTKPNFIHLHFKTFTNPTASYLFSILSTQNLYNMHSAQTTQSTYSIHPCPPQVFVHTNLTFHYKLYLWKFPILGNFFFFHEVSPQSPLPPSFFCLI